MSTDLLALTKAELEADPSISIRAMSRKLRVSGHRITELRDAGHLQFKKQVGGGWHTNHPLKLRSAK